MRNFFKILLLIITIIIILAYVYLNIYTGRLTLPEFFNFLNGVLK